jgi:hypothetical protein
MIGNFGEGSTRLKFSGCIIRFWAVIWWIHVVDMLFPFDDCHNFDHFYGVESQ